MRVRFAQREDLRAVLAMARTMLEESRFGQQAFNEGKAKAAVESLLDAPASSCLLLACDARGRPAGMLAAQVMDDRFCDGLMAHSLWFYVLPEHRAGSAAAKLLDALRRWAELRNAQEILVGMTTAIDMQRFDAAMSRAGYQRCGANFSLPLSQDALRDNDWHSIMHYAA